MERTYTITEAQALYYEDLARQRGQRGRLLELLLDGAWHTNHECSEIGGVSHNDSFFSLRQAGWLIESRRIEGGTWQFRLAGKADPPVGHKPLTRPQRVVVGHVLHVISETLGDLALVRVSKNLPAWMKCEPKEIESAS